jgi:glycosyltransferase involved in cell wall biosynthesis
MARSQLVIRNNYLSALVITYNEEINISRTLKSIEWIPLVLVVDSGSNDNTINIINQYSNTKILYRKFDTFADQCNFGLRHLQSNWVLSLDADYVLSSALSNEIKTIFSSYISKSIYSGYNISFSYCIGGKPIQSGLLPPRTCLYERKKAKYINIGHGHKVLIEGRIGNLIHKIYHDDRKSFNIWFKNQERYQQAEASMLKKTDSRSLSIQDQIRKHSFVAPFVVFFICIVFRRGFLDGKQGFIYAFQRLITESLLYIYLND